MSCRGCVGVCECSGRSQLALWCLLKNNNNLKLTLEKELYRTLDLSILMRRQSANKPAFIRGVLFGSKKHREQLQKPKCSKLH